MFEPDFSVHSRMPADKILSVICQDMLCSITLFLHCRYCCSYLWFVL